MPDAVAVVESQNRTVCPYKEEFANVLPNEIQKWCKAYEGMHDFQEDLVDQACVAVQKILSQSVRPADGTRAEELKVAITKYRNIVVKV